MIELGAEQSEKMAMPKDTKKTSYPSITLRDEAYDAFKKEVGQCVVGDIHEGYAKLKVTGLSDNEYGRSVTLDVLSLDELESEEGESTEPDEKPAAKSKYKNPAVGAALKASK